MTDATSSSAEQPDQPMPVPDQPAAVGSGSEISPAADSTATGTGPQADSASGGRSKYLFFAAVSAVVLALDVGSKAWAEVVLSHRGPFENTIDLIRGHLSLVLAYNKGGAWGMLQGAPDMLRRPFFLLVSVVAVLFIVSLYRRLHANQWALRWGLPLVLGGALGNLTDRIARTGVVDFIDYRGSWVEGMNRLVAKLSPNWVVTDHWPTFNVADIAICVGVGLMALDVLFSRRRPSVGRQNSKLETSSIEPGPSS